MTTAGPLVERNVLGPRRARRRCFVRFRDRRLFCNCHGVVLFYEGRRAASARLNITRSACHRKRAEASATLLIKHPSSGKVAVQIFEMESALFLPPPLGEGKNKAAEMRLYYIYRLYGCRQ
jgi:hypothetical protein